MTEKLSEGAGLLDIELAEGSDFSRTLTWTDSNAALIDLTGYSAKMHIRKKSGLTGTPDLELTDGAGLITRLLRGNVTSIAEVTK